MEIRRGKFELFFCRENGRDVIIEFVEVKVILSVDFGK